MKYIKYFNESVSFEEGRQMGFPYTQVELSDLLIDLTDYGFEVKKLTQYFTDGRVYSSTNIINAKYAITDIILEKRKSTDYTRTISTSHGGFGTRYIELIKGDKESEIIQDSLIELCRRIKETYYSVNSMGGIIEIFIKIETPVVESDKNKVIEDLILSKSRSMLSEKMEYVRRKFKQEMKRTGRTLLMEKILENKVGETMISNIGKMDRGITYTSFNLDNIKTKKSRSEVYSILEDINELNNRVLSDFGKSELREITEKDIEIMNELFEMSDKNHFRERYLGLTTIVSTFNYKKAINNFKKLASIGYKN